MESTTDYKGIDVTKLLMAFLVIILHTNPFADFNSIIEWTSRGCITVIAVPFFFIANGFFGLTNDNTTKKSLKKLLKLYLIWSVIYLPFSFIKIGNNNFFLKYIYRFFVCGSYDTIWYLLASFVGLIIVWILKKLGGIKLAFLFMMALHFFAVIGTSYYGLIEHTIFENVYSKYYEIFITFKNGLFFGGVYIALGGLLYELSKEKNPIIQNKRTIILSTITFAIMGIESAVCKYFNLSTKGVDMKFSLILLSFFIFILVLNCHPNISAKKSLLFRKMSTLMFLTQRLFLTGYELLGIHANSFIRFALITIFTLLFSYLIIVLSDKFKPLRYIY